MCSGGLAEAKVRKTKKVKKTTTKKTLVKKKAPAKKPAPPPNPLAASLFWVDPWPTAHQGVWVVYSATQVAVSGGTPEFQSTVPLTNFPDAQGEAACLQDPTVAQRAKQIKGFLPGSTLDYFVVKSGVPETQRPVLLVTGHGGAKPLVLWQTVFCRLAAGQALEPFVAWAAQAGAEAKDPWIALDGALSPDVVTAVPEAERQRLEAALARNPAQDPYLTFAVLSDVQLRALAKNSKINEIFQNALGTLWSGFFLSSQPQKSVVLKALLDLTKDGSWDLILVEEKTDFETKRSVYGKSKTGNPVLRGRLSSVLAL